MADSFRLVNGTGAKPVCGSVHLFVLHTVLNCVGERDTDCEHDSVLQELTLASEKLPPVSG
jgi:hypothetical protein